MGRNPKDGVVLLGVDAGEGVSEQAQEQQGVLEEVHRYSVCWRPG